jgi:LacI family transcriptional regulator
MISKIRLIDIAKKANVSLGTVDRVVNNRGKVAPQTELKIRRILEEFDYQTNLMASSLSSKKKPVFNVLVPKPQGEDYWYKILTGIETTEKSIMQFGIKITKSLYDQDDNIQFAGLASQILKTSCDGVLLAPLFHKEAKGFVNDLEKQNIPYVLIDSPIEGSQSLCSISQDYFQSGVLAAKLIDYGLNRNDELLSISNLMYSDYFEHVQERLNGLKYFFETQTTKKRTIHFLEIVNPKFDKLATILKEKLLQFPKIKSIFIDNSKAHWVGRILDENKISEIKLIGFDLIEQNIRYLQNGIIDFILFDYAENQGEQGLQFLFDYVVLKKTISKEIKMPIYIITKENLEGFLPDHSA